MLNVPLKVKILEQIKQEVLASCKETVGREYLTSVLPNACLGSEGITSLKV